MMWLRMLAAVGFGVCCALFIAEMPGNAQAAMLLGMLTSAVWAKAMERKR